MATGDRNPLALSEARRLDVARGALRPA